MARLYAHNDYSLVTEFNGKLVVFGKYLSTWEADDKKCPHLEVVDFASCHYYLMDPRV